MPDSRGDERSESYSDYRKSLEQEIHSRVRADIRDRIWRRRQRSKNTHGVIIAGLLILAGVLLFLDNIGVLHAGNLWDYWPLALVAIGAAKFWESRYVGGKVWGGMMFATGVCFLLSNLGIWHISFNIIWPLGLIAVGILMLSNALERKRAPESGLTPSPGFVSPENALREWSVFGGIKRRLDTKDFQGGEMLAVFGGIEIDLRRAAIATPNHEVTVEANATFGGIELRVPEDWLVVIRGLGIFGGYVDKTIPPKPQEGVITPKLIVTGYAVFGGVNVEN
ncbi:MAG TPA: DUF5668 domain-containing protein [Bryobacteraceae bacterium]|nr:DUF5668 domain-containing protein [Bryobacteraceae bacterium]